jgi:hypothetical protein
MIKRNSVEWEQFVMQLNKIRKKSNWDVLCTKCWQFFNIKQKKKHLEELPCHANSILTSRQFASEQKFSHIANAYNKFIKKADGYEYLWSPFVPKSVQDNFLPQGDESQS